jgi:hypothetical protein
MGEHIDFGVLLSVNHSVILASDGEQNRLAPSNVSPTQITKDEGPVLWQGNPRQLRTTVTVENAKRMRALSRGVSSGSLKSNG